MPGDQVLGGLGRDTELSAAVAPVPGPVPGRARGSRLVAGIILTR